jgi:hypothetical protein
VWPVGRPGRALLPSLLLLLRLHKRRTSYTLENKRGKYKQIVKYILSSQILDKWLIYEEINFYILA